MRSSVVLFLFPEGEKLKERNCLVFLARPSTVQIFKHQLYLLYCGKSADMIVFCQWDGEGWMSLLDFVFVQLAKEVLFEGGDHGQSAESRNGETE